MDELKRFSDEVKANVRAGTQAARPANEGREHSESLIRTEDGLDDRLSYREETVAIMHELTRFSDEVARDGTRTRHPSL